MNDFFAEKTKQLEKIVQNKNSVADSFKKIFNFSRFFLQDLINQWRI
jgi:hypothetical protein